MRQRRYVSGAVVGTLVGALALSVPPAAAQHRAARPVESRPPSGIGGMVVGWAGLGIGSLNLATLPVCFADFYPSELKTVCIVTSVVFATGGLSAGIIGLSVGYPRRAAYRRWRQTRVGAQLERLHVTPLRNGALLGYAARF